VHEAAKLREKGSGSGAIGELRESAEHVFFANGESSADGVRIDPNALELSEQVFKAFRL
jgi:hypothetical protein